MNQPQNTKALDHYFDQADCLREQRLPFSLLPIFVDRGNPAVDDRETGDFTKDGTWRDWDLSAIVPAGAKAVLLKVFAQATVAGAAFIVRKDGNSTGATTAGLITQVANGPLMNMLTVAISEAGVIEYNASNHTWAYLYVTVCGWWK